ncbi:MAG TPA: Wzz/FepE/Etk N-terminal domain-containing protein, partial [Gemmatimonadales bacterium]|nr:Wzz/FepE/Etk N-terminal domain-containing protein [Gemmatimonadales bacterium]
MDDDPGLRVGELIAVLTRSKWLILGCVIVCFGAAVLYARKATRVYQATVSLRIQEKQPNLPDVFRTFSQSNDVATDIEVLVSRSLAEEATRILGLQVRLVSPVGVARDAVIEDIQAAPDAARMDYRLTRQSDGSFDVQNADGLRLSNIRPGDQLALPGVTLRLKTAATRYAELRFGVRPLSQAVVRSSQLSAGRASKDADIIKLRYEDTDRGLVWKVPNVIAERFIEGRQETQKAETRNQ